MHEKSTRKDRVEMVEDEYQEKAEEGSDLKALFDKYISIETVKNIG